MLFDIPKAIESFCNMVNKVSDTYKTSKEVQSESEIIKDRKSLQKAVDVAEKVFELSYRYISYFSEKDKKEFGKLYDKFQKYN